MKKIEFIHLLFSERNFFYLEFKIKKKKKSKPFLKVYLFYSDF